MIDVQKKYDDCLSDLISKLITKCKNEIYSIILYGGLVRDKIPLEGWSDIDLLIILKEYNQKNNEFIGMILKNLEIKYQIRLDVSILYQMELENEYLVKSIYKGELLNVLAFRENVSKVIYGNKPQINISIEQEKNAALFYINSTLYTLRIYLTENIYKAENIQYDVVLPRLIRWTFSIIRESLRLFDIYSHPYEPSIPQIRSIVSNLDSEVLDKLIKIRKGEHVMENYVIHEIEEFLEKFIPIVIRLYYEKINENNIRK